MRTALPFSPFSFLSFCDLTFVLHKNPFFPKNEAIILKPGTFG